MDTVDTVSDTVDTLGTVYSACFAFASWLCSNASLKNILRYFEHLQLGRMGLEAASKLTFLIL